MRGAEVLAGHTLPRRYLRAADIGHSASRLAERQFNQPWRGFIGVDWLEREATRDRYDRQLRELDESLQDIVVEDRRAEQRPRQTAALHHVFDLEFRAHITEGVTVNTDDRDVQQVRRAPSGRSGSDEILGIWGVTLLRLARCTMVPTPSTAESIPAPVLRSPVTN